MTHCRKPWRAVNRGVRVMENGIIASSERFAAIDAGKRQRAWALLSREIDSILDRFFEQLPRPDECGSLSDIDIAGLKGAVKGYWENAFATESPESLLETMNVVHVKHKEIGVTLADYISTHMFLLREFHHAIMLHASGPRRAYEVIAVVDLLIQASVDSAIHVFDDVLAV